MKKRPHRASSSPSVDWIVVSKSLELLRGDIRKLAEAIAGLGVLRVEMDHLAERCHDLEQTQASAVANAEMISATRAHSNNTRQEVADGRVITERIIAIMASVATGWVKMLDDLAKLQPR